MKDQYVGDINDYRKYALLRALAAGGANRIGVCWMRTPDDGGSHGSKLEYLEKPERYRRFDPELFDILAHAAAVPDRRRLETIENSGAIAGAFYHNDPLPQDAAGRAAYMATCHTKFASADLIFVDPDNGIDVPSSRVGRKTALKYVFLNEIAAFYAEGKSVLIYQQRPKLQPMQNLVTACHTRLGAIAPNGGIWAFHAAQVVFFLLVHPESPARVASAAMAAVKHWGSEFVTGKFLGAEPPTP